MRIKFYQYPQKNYFLVIGLLIGVGIYAGLYIGSNYAESKTVPEVEGEFWPS